MAFLRIQTLIKSLVSTSLILTSVACINGCASTAPDEYKDMTAQQIYQKGKESVQKHNNPQAIKDFDALEARYPYGEYTDKSQLALINAYSSNEDGAEAIATADRFIRMHPRHPNVDYAYYMKGVVNYNENFSWAFRNLPLDRSTRASTFAQDSFDSFKLLIEKFPNSRYAADARKRMIIMREQLADHELEIANYYLDQGAELAAANRASYIVNQFPRTEAVPDALVIMHDSYLALGMKPQSQEAMEMLKLNFPQYYLDYVK